MGLGVSMRDLMLSPLGKGMAVLASLYAYPAEKAAKDRLHVVIQKNFRWFAKAFWSELVGCSRKRHSEEAVVLAKALGCYSLAGHDAHDAHAKR